MPDDLAALADRNATELGDRHFAGEVARLVDALSSPAGKRPQFGNRLSPAPVHWLLIALGGLLAASALWSGWLAHAPADRS